MLTGSTIKGSRAVDALTSAVGSGPQFFREARVFGGISLCHWDTPWLERLVIPENDELIVAYHRRGSRGVRKQLQGTYSRTCSFPGLLTLIPPGTPITYDTGGPVGFTTLHLSRLALNEFSRLGAELSTLDRFAFRHPFVASCIDSLIREARAQDKWSSRFSSAVTEALFFALLKTPEVAIPADEGFIQLTQVVSARALIDANPASDLSVKALARQAGVSMAHFARIFRIATGETPHRYVMTRRIEFAQRLLSDNRISLKTIAQEAGFSSQAHMTHLFSIRTGITPKQYRASYALDQPVR